MSSAQVLTAIHYINRLLTYLLLRVTATSVLANSTYYQVTDSLTLDLDLCRFPASDAAILRCAVRGMSSEVLMM